VIWSQLFGRATLMSNDLRRARVRMDNTLDNVRHEISGNRAIFEKPALRCILRAFNERQKKTGDRHVRGVRSSACRGRHA
jgi:hypothetical protein